MSAELAVRLLEMGIRDQRVLKAMADLPRSLFVPEQLRGEADADRPLPIGFSQTISQPYMVAYMSEELRLQGTERVLEIGTGSGYQTAVLALCAREVYSIEIVPELAARAAEVLFGELRLENVSLRLGDGAQGWPEQAPFDRVLVTAAAATVPETLVEELAPGGRMVLPVGNPEDVQMLKVIERGSDGVELVQDLLPVRFVPMTGKPGPAGM